MPSCPFFPSRLPLRASFHRERDVWVQGRCSYQLRAQRHTPIPDTGTSPKQTPRVGPCLSLLHLFDSLKEEHHLGEHKGRPQRAGVD